MGNEGSRGWARRRGLVAGGFRGWALVVCVVGVATASAAGASPGAAGEQWQSGHMQSQYRSVLAVPSRAPELRGEARYEHLKGEPAVTPGTVPPSTIGAVTQRSWESGPDRGPGKRTRLGHGPGAGSAGHTTSGLNGTRHKNKPPGLRPRKGGTKTGRRGGGSGGIR